DDPRTDRGYRVLVGSLPGNLTLFDDYSHHPLPEPPGIQYAPGAWSTAAGRYQILSRYWPHYQRLLGLPDFGPESQDRYAIQQIIEQGAMPDVKAGRVREAVRKCNNIWASLPGSQYGQRTVPYHELIAAYRAAGGRSHADG
ncbi:glycoside hydrolase family 24 protein, partial [Photobacterium sanguinicancri]|uniref:glycoside hydrolase family 24 protein n=1 Tax=Photobacterium sanguinicancri TaxID=875932 RepID=UPI00113FD1BA